MNDLTKHYLLQTIEVMEQNFLSQLKVLRGTILASMPEEVKAPTRVEMKRKEVDANAELAKFFGDIEGVNVRGADERNIPASETGDK